MTRAELTTLEAEMVRWIEAKTRQLNKHKRVALISRDNATLLENEISVHEERLKAVRGAME